MPDRPWELIIAQEMARARQRRPVNKKIITEDDDFQQHCSLETSHGFSHLPHELLLHVFRATVPPLYQHDPSVIQGPRNPWLAALRARKALTLTCKAFLGPATEVLYEDIVIRRMGQIPALARTLGPFPPASGRDVGTLVRRLRMDGCVVWAPCAQIVREDLRLILQRCTALRSFSFHPHPHFPFADYANDDDDSRDGFNPSWLLQPDSDRDSVGGSLRERLCSSLRLLDLAVTLDEALLVRLQWFLSAATNLTILKLGPVLDEEYSNELLGLPTLRLPALEELKLHADEPSFQHYISTHWELPCLRLLTANGCEEVPEDLLRAHGSQLTYFHMRHGFSFAWEVPQFAPLERLGELCPIVEHLIIPTWMNDPLVINSPTLRFLDIWGHHPPHFIKEGWYKLSETSALPNLKRVRIISTMPRSGWESTQCLDWPLICHPTAVAGEEQHLFAFPGVRVVQTEWRILHDYQDEDLSWGGSGAPERRDLNPRFYEDDGDTSLTESEDTDPETSYISSIEDELEDLLGDGGPVPVEQYGRDMILRMFHDSQERDYMFDDDQ